MFTIQSLSFSAYFGILSLGETEKVHKDGCEKLRRIDKEPFSDLQIYDRCMKVVVHVSQCGPLYNACLLACFAAAFLPSRLEATAEVCHSQVAIQLT